MNFKTPFKVLTTAALIGTLSLSAVAPGVASAADKTVTAQAETPANFALEKVILVKGDSKISVSFDTYIDVLGNEKALNGYELAYVVAANGEVFALDTYVDFYEAGNTEEEVVEKLSKAGKTSEVTEVKDGAFNDGKLEPVEDTAATAKADLEKAVAAAKATEIKDAAAKAELTKAIEAAEKAAAKEDATKEELEAAKAELTKAVAAAKKADAEAALEAKVESVTAINSTEFKVTFSKKVDKTTAEDETNYTAEAGANYSAVDLAPTSAKLQEDGKTVIVRSSASLVKGTEYEVTVKNITTDKFDKIANYEGTFSVTADNAPTLKSTKYIGGAVEFTFDEEVDLTTAIVKVDGSVANDATTFQSVATTDAGDYVYTLNLSGDEVEEGEHQVSLVNVKDVNDNEASTISTSYKVEEDATKPTIASVKAVAGSNAYEVTFSEAVTAPTVKTFRGNAELTSSASNVGGTPTAKKWTVTVTNNGSNTVFADDTTKSALSFELTNFKDAAGLIGEKYTGNVTVEKDTVAPTIKNVAVNTVEQDTTNVVITIPFNEALVLSDGTITVKDPDGIYQTAVASLENGNKDLVLTITNANLKDGKYTVALGKGAVTDLADNENAAITTSATTAASTAVYDFTSNGTVTPSTAVVGGKNVNKLTVAYVTAMDESALDVANYKLDNAALPAGTEIGFFGDNKTVEITFPETFKVSKTDTEYKFEISKNVKTKAGEAVVKSAATPKEAYTQTIELEDNVAPVLKSAKLVADTTETTKFNTITLTYSEALATLTNNADTKADFIVTIGGVEVPVTAVSGTGTKEVTLTVADLYALNQTVTVKQAPKSTTNADINVEDAAGNLVTTGTTVTATK